MGQILSFRELPYLLGLMLIYDIRTKGKKTESQISENMKYATLLKSLYSI